MAPDNQGASADRPGATAGAFFLLDPFVDADFAAGPSSSPPSQATGSGTGSGRRSASGETGNRSAPGEMDSRPAPGLVQRARSSGHSSPYSPPRSPDAANQAPPLHRWYSGPYQSTEEYQACFGELTAGWLLKIKEMRGPIASLAGRVAGRSA